MKIDKKDAEAIVREEFAQIDTGDNCSNWIDKVEKLSRLCAADGSSATHIAFLGTAMLAKSVDRNVDLFAIKPRHVPDNPSAFSARSLCHGVLVPLAAELGFSIGVTGREPLNNQPYFRMTQLDDGTPVHPGARAAFDYMIELVRELDASDEAEARRALRAYVVVRRKYQPRYVDPSSVTVFSPDRLTAVIRQLVLENSEGGRRAQAVVAGLMDVFAGQERVESGRINDPSRKYPGDVCVRSVDIEGVWEKAIEVRDKPVTISDAQIFGKKCVDLGVREGALVMVSERQDRLDQHALADWANDFGIGLTLFHGWTEFVEQALYWSKEPKPVAAGKATRQIHDRLVAVEVSASAVALWRRLTQV